MCPKPSNYFPGVTLTPKTSTTQMQPSVHESGPPPFFPKRTRSHYGTTMGLFQSFRYATININALVVSDRPQPFTMNFPRADIHELLTSDLLHQAIKGTFKDHLVVWVEDYLKIVHGSSVAESILDEIDRQYVGLKVQSTQLTFSQHCTCTPLPWPTEVQAGTKLQTMDRQ